MGMRPEAWLRWFLNKLEEDRKNLLLYASFETVNERERSFLQILFSVYKKIQLRTPEDFNITGKHTGAKKSNVTKLVWFYSAVREDSDTIQLYSCGKSFPNTPKQLR